MHCMVAETQRTQMLKGLLDPCLLAVIGTREAYGYEIASRLDSAGLGDVAEGSVYPALSRLERTRLIVSERRPSESGPARKYYQLTSDGRAYLETWRAAWAALAASVDAVLGTRTAKENRKESA